MSKVLINLLSEKLNTGELLEIVDNSLASTQVLAKLGYSNKGQYVIIVRDFLENNEVDTSHWTITGKPKVIKEKRICPVCNNTFHPEDKSTRKQTTCSISCSNTYFRSNKDNPNWANNPSYSYRKKALQFYGAVCTKCEYSVLPALVVHHKDKNRKNNNISNLEVLCANCHAITHYSDKE